MKFWTDKAGKELTFQEFMTRWKQGMQSISPLQQFKSMQWGYLLMIIGSITGIVISIVTHLWWLVIILLGNLVINGLAFLGNWQKIKLLSGLETQMKSFEVPQEIKGNYIQ